MIKIFTFLLQLFLIKKSISAANSPLQKLEYFLHRSRIYFFFSIGWLMSLVFLVTACIVAVIAVGLQIEKQGFLSLNGLMISALLFLIISVFIFLISFFILLFQRQKLIEAEKSESTREESDLGSEITKLLLQFVSNVKKSSHRKRRSKNQDDSKEKNSKSENETN